MKDYSILIVDDSETDRYLLKRSFQKAEIISEVFEAENGQEALDFLSDYDNNKNKFGPKFPPVIIFLDINMPLVDGFEFLELFSKLRTSKEEYKTSVLVMFSSSDNEDDRKKAFTYGFVKDYIIKGNAGPKALREKINSIIDDFKN